MLVFPGLHFDMSAQVEPEQYLDEQGLEEFRREAAASSQVRVTDVCWLILNPNLFQAEVSGPDTLSS